jgi:hypothetical protein
MHSARVVDTATPWWRPLARADRLAVVWFVVIPAILFITPALVGHPSISADNLIQNFPLRVLAGRQIASGHLPLLDPLTNAGTPLLGGMNAGALYPLTFLFAFLPPITAWVINLIAIYVTASLGMFALLRWHGLRTWASFAAALSYAYTGAMIGQLVHLGVVQGFSFIPWAVLVVLALSKRVRALGDSPTWRHYALAMLPWTLGVAALWGLTLLTGEPRAIAVIELLTLIVVPAVLLLRSSYQLITWKTRFVYLVTLAVGFVWGVALGLVQLLPGWSFINFSQRSTINYSFFGAGSLAVRWTALLLTPNLFGGNGVLGQQSYYANYNLAEVTGYAGILALLALFAFLSRVTWKGWRANERNFTIYLIVGVIGLFATWGSFTPFGHLFRIIPLFGSTRLQSRNIILVDFALAVILGWWFDRVHEPRDARSGLTNRFRWFTVLPGLCVVVLSISLLAWGPAVVHRISISTHKYNLAVGGKLVNVLYLVLALAAVVVVVGFRYSRHLFSMLFAILAANIVLFLLFSSTGIVGPTGPSEPSRAYASSLLGTQGRFALVDTGGSHSSLYHQLGEPNTNVFTGLQSVQGYGSLISMIYDNATGTHPQTSLNACALDKGVFTQLRLDALAVASSQLITNETTATPPSPSCVPIRRSAVAQRYFGQRFHVSSISLTGGNDALATGSVTVQLLNGEGQPVGEAQVDPSGRNDTVHFKKSPLLAAGFVVTGAHGVLVTGAQVTTYAGATYSLDNETQQALDQSRWHLTSTQHTFSVFKAGAIRPIASFESSASARVTSIRTAATGDTWVGVDVSHAAFLSLSDEYLPGWRATALNTVTGHQVELNVIRRGLIEAVAVPTGTWTIHFHYHAPYIETGVAASSIALVLFLGVGAMLLVSRRRKPGDKVSA